MNEPGKIDFWHKIVSISFIYSLFIVALHNNAPLNYVNDGSVIALCNEYVVYFVKMLGELALPSFLIISGMLMYRNFDLGMFRAKCKSRIYSLVVPYLVWNCLNLLYEITVANTPFIAQYFVRKEAFAITTEHILRGIFFHGAGGVAWFLFDLIVFTALAPLFYLLLKNRVTGMLTLLCFYVCSVFNFPVFSFLEGADKVAYYLFGAYVGLHGFRYAQNVLSSSQARANILCFAGLFILFLLGWHWYPVWDVPLTIMLCVSGWYCFDYVRIKPYAWLPGMSMFIYMSHVNVEACIAKVWVLLLPLRSSYELIAYFGSMIMAIAVILGCGIFLRKKMPRIFEVLVGGRG